MNIYGLLKKSTINTNKGRFMFERDFENDMHHDFPNVGKMIDNYKIIGPVDVEGYINNECIYTAPYAGRYGKGFIVCKPEYYMGRKSTKYMRMYYYIKKEN